MDRWCIENHAKVVVRVDVGDDLRESRDAIGLKPLGKGRVQLSPCNHLGAIHGTNVFRIIVEPFVNRTRV